MLRRMGFAPPPAAAPSRDVPAAALESQSTSPAPIGPSPPSHRPPGPCASPSGIEITPQRLASSVHYRSSIRQDSWAAWQPELRIDRAWTWAGMLPLVSILCGAILTAPAAETARSLKWIVATVPPLMLLPAAVRDLKIRADGGAWVSPRLRLRTLCRVKCAAFFCQWALGVSFAVRLTPYSLSPGFELGAAMAAILIQTVVLDPVRGRGHRAEAHRWKTEQPNQ